MDLAALPKQWEQRRIELIMSEGSHVTPPPLVKRRSNFVIVGGAVLVFVAVFALSVFAGVVFAFRQPRMCEGFVQIFARQELLTDATSQHAQASAADTIFLQTQFEIIQSQKILMPVIEQLKLMDRWGKGEQKLSPDAAYRMLRSRLAVRRYRNTRLIEIVVRDLEPATAAEMAKAVAESYQTDGLKVAQAIYGSDKLREEMEMRSMEPVEFVDIGSRKGPDCAVGSGFLCLSPELATGLRHGALIGLPLALFLSLLTTAGLSRKRG